MIVFIIYKYSYSLWVLFLDKNIQSVFFSQTGENHHITQELPLHDYYISGYLSFRIYRSTSLRINAS